MAVSQNEQKYNELRTLNQQKAKRLRELQIANENRRKIDQPDEEDEQAVENYDA